jgi:hypothetical protein
VAGQRKLWLLADVAVGAGLEVSLSAAAPGEAIRGPRCHYD